jgi:hypothetical protein
LKASQNRIFNFASFYIVYLPFGSLISLYASFYIEYLPFGSPISLCKFLYRIPSLLLTYLSMKQGSLFCFVLFYHTQISQIMALHAMFLASLESSRWVGVHHLGLRLVGGAVWKLLIIESFCQWKLNKIKTENNIWNLCSHLGQWHMLH